MNWFDRHPEHLAEQSEPAEALAALRELDELTSAQCVALDIYLNHWVLVVLLRPNDREAILEIQQLCGLARVLAEKAPDAQAFCTRWKAFGDLLEGKRHALQMEAIEVPAKLLHEDAILKLAAQPQCRQSDVAAALALSAGRVSQLLGTLEAQGKIVRQRKGKESWVSLPVVAQGKPQAGSGQLEPGGAAYQLFRWQKAA